MKPEEIHPVVKSLDSVSSSFFDATAMANFEARLLADTFLSVYSKEAQSVQKFKGIESEDRFPYGFSAVNLLAVDLRSEKKESITLSGVVCHREGRLRTLKFNFNDHICWQLVNVSHQLKVRIDTIDSSKMDNNLLNANKSC